MYTFKKEERLCNKKLIDELFHSGSSFLCYPFRVSWLVVRSPQQSAIQVLFAVSKKRYKKAVDRNLVKRRMREAYRLHKADLLLTPAALKNTNVVFSVGYIGKEIVAFDFIEKKMIRVLKQLSEQAIK